MNRDALLNDWRREETQPFAGWDFSYLAGRMTEDKEPWSYMDRAAALLDAATSAVDLDTGGAERLLKLREHWPPRMVATEEYPPNLALARQRLEPLGVPVVPVSLTDDDPMPFANGEFDLILNRHGAFNPAEIARCLARGGTFLTQQVHGLAEWDLVAAFGATQPYADATPAKYVPQLQAAGLTIVDLQEWQGRLRFTDVGAIVYYLKATPWTVPGFSVESHARYLFALQERVEAGEELSFVWWLYLIEAVRS